MTEPKINDDETLRGALPLGLLRAGQTVPQQQLRPDRDFDREPLAGLKPCTVREQTIKKQAIEPNFETCSTPKNSQPTQVYVQHRVIAQD